MRSSRVMFVAAVCILFLIQLFRIHFSKGDCVFFKGEGGKLGDLSGATSYPTFSGVNVYFVDDVTRW